MREITLSKAVKGFVAASNAHDFDALLGTFAPGAVVVDGGIAYGTDAALREWIKVHLVDPKIIITPQSFEGNRLEAWTGDKYAGGPWIFSYTFTTREDAITHLTITRL